MRVISWNAKIWSIIRGRNWDYGQNKFLRGKKCNDECKYLYKITFLINWLKILAKNVMYNIVAILVKKEIVFRVEIWYLFQRQMAVLFVWVIHTCFNDYNDLQKNSRQSVKEKNVSTNIHQMKEQVPFKKHQNFWIVNISCRIKGCRI